MLVYFNCFSAHCAVLHSFQRAELQKPEGMNDNWLFILREANVSGRFHIVWNGTRNWRGTPNTE